MTASDLGHYVGDGNMSLHLTLNADQFAYEKANLEYNNVYYQTLRQKTKRFTNKMIEGSTKSLAELIRQAWIEARRPKVPNEITF